MHLLLKECSRFVLPLATPTRLYMTGSLRSWIHYIDLRSAHGTQKEHMDIANGAKEIFIEQFPTISTALSGSNMPTYPVKNNKTGEKQTLSMTMKEYDQWRKDNPDWDKDWHAVLQV